METAAYMIEVPGDDDTVLDPNCSKFVNLTDLAAARAKARNTTGVDYKLKARMAGYPCLTSGLLQGWGDNSGGDSDLKVVQRAPQALKDAVKGIDDVMPDVEIAIGPDVKGAVFGFVEYQMGPQYVILNRCPIKRNAVCRLEFHEVPANITTAPT